MKKILLRQWFLFGLGAVIALGLGLSDRLEPLTEAAIFKNILVASVLFLMALPLETRTMWGAIRRPKPVLLAVSVNLGLLPLLAWGVSLGLRGEMAIGVLVVAAMPCTLASAAVWTRRAGGNDAVAILTTIVTNLSCFVVTPLWLLTMTGSRVEIELGPMIAKLGLLVVLPMVAAQAVRRYAPLARWATSRKSGLSIAAQCGILAMVLIGAAKSGLELGKADWENGFGMADFLVMAVAVLAIHTVGVWLGHVVGRAAGIARPERIAIGFAGSQKTLMVGLYIVVTYFGGLAILPMVVYHVGQLIVDTVIADRLAAVGARREP